MLLDNRPDAIERYERPSYVLLHHRLDSPVLPHVSRLRSIKRYIYPIQLFLRINGILGSRPDGTRKWLGDQCEMFLWVASLTETPAECTMWGGWMFSALSVVPYTGSWRR
jgi:hypothetical protein